MINKNDWANKNKYYLANEEFIKQSSDNDCIVFIGDSITEFWENKDPLFFKLNYFINRGISGQTTSQILHRFQDDVIALNPKAVIILAGINDIAENLGPISIEAIFENIISMIQIAHKNSITVFLCSILPANHFNWKPKINPTAKICKLNQLLSEYAKSHSIPYVNYFDSMIDYTNGLKIDYSNDGVHPNIEGYNLMKTILLKVIQDYKK